MREHDSMSNIRAIADHLLSTFPIPNAALDDRLGWIGTSGSGKTYNAGGGVERVIASKGRVVIVDPLDVWWGLRLKADGTPSPHNVVIFGGAHGDLPLTEQAGALIGETVAGMSESCIVSLGSLTTKAAERRFMLAFLDAIYRSADASKADPFHIVFDEADLWAPQKSSEPMLQSRMEEIVRRGRIKGFIPWLITQRPAVLSKDVLSQVDGLVAFKLTSSQDRDAIGAWIEGQADRSVGKEILGSLPTMQRGEGVVWVPGRGILQTSVFPPKQTFDSSRTPKRGERRESRDLKPLNLDALKGKLASIEEETKASDPKALKAEIARLTRELAKAQRSLAAPPEPVTVVANADAIDAARAEGERIGVSVGIARARAAIDAMRVDGPPTKVAIAQTRPSHGKSVIGAQAIVAAVGVTGPQQRILNALAWWKAFGIEQPQSEQVAFIAGYSASSSGYANLKGAMRSLGFIDYPQPGRVGLTQAGADKSEAPATAVTQDAFHDAVRTKLSAPQRRLLDPLIAAYPDAMRSDDLAVAADYSTTSSGYANLKGSMRSLGFLDYPSPGHVRASDWLFPA